MLSVDLNGDTQRFGTITEAQDEGELRDMGNVVHWDLNRRGTNLPTCRAHGSKTDTRRGFLFCSTTLLPDVRATGEDRRREWESKAQ